MESWVAAVRMRGAIEIQKDYRFADVRPWHQPRGRAASHFIAERRKKADQGGDVVDPWVLPLLRRCEHAFPDLGANVFEPVVQFQPSAKHQ